MLTSVRRVLVRLRSDYIGWIARSQGQLSESARLLNDARTWFDAARAIGTDRLAWCARCGERLRVGNKRARTHQGIHERCYSDQIV